MRVECQKKSIPFQIVIANRLEILEPHQAIKNAESPFKKYRILMRETTFRVSQKSATTTPTEPKGDTSQSEQPSGNGFELEVRAWPSSQIRLQLQLQLPAKEKNLKSEKGREGK